LSFAVTRLSRPDGVCVAVSGEVDIDTAPRMRRALLEAVEAGQPVVVDLGAVTFMDSSGLAALIVAQRAAQAAGATVELAEVPAPVRRLLSLTGMDTFLTYRPAAGEAPA
jgi:anti-sigma B factor antagonist